MTTATPMAPNHTYATSKEQPLTDARDIPRAIESHPAFGRVQHHIQQQLCAASFTGTLPQPAATVSDVVEAELGNAHPLSQNPRFMADVLNRLASSHKESLN